MEIIEVTTSKHEKQFLDIHKKLNMSNPNWIQPLDKDVRWVFDPDKNKAFNNGSMARWLLQLNGEVIGRIAAFHNRSYTNKGDKYPVGSLGFFECIEDQAAANMLFDQCRKWLEPKGVKAMDGPINFGERDKFWGLLVEGFQPPLYGMSYNPAYYKQLFENYGFKVFYNQICWDMEVLGGEQLGEKAYQHHKRFEKDPDFSARYMGLDQIEKIAEDFCQVYNKAWAQHEGNKTMKKETALKIMKTLKPIADPRLIWFAYYHDEPIAMWINIPDINQLMKKFRGNLNLINKIRFWIGLKMGRINKIVGLIFGIVPEFQGQGIDNFIIVEGEKVIKRETNYKNIELLWQGDFNPKIINLTEKLGAKRSRKLCTYRFLFDRNEQFERHPILN